jgi:hypothetical protein
MATIKMVVKIEAKIIFMEFDERQASHEEE